MKEKIRILAGFKGMCFSKCKGFPFYRAERVFIGWKLLINCVIRKMLLTKLYLSDFIYNLLLLIMHTLTITAAKLNEWFQL